MKIILAIGFVVVCAIALSGCGTSSAVNRIIESRTDSVIKRLEAIDDKIIRALVEAQELAERKVERLKKAKCKLPYEGLVRYARTSDKNRVAVAEDCGLFVNNMQSVTIK